MDTPSHNTRSSQNLPASPNAFTEEMRVTIEAAIDKHMTSFQATITALTSELKELKESLTQKDNRIAELEQRILQLEDSPPDNPLHARIAQLEAEHDALEQYGRRLNVRVENVPLLADESPTTLQDQVLGMMTAAGAAISPADVLRLHRSTAPRSKPGESAKSSQVIVRLNNWRARESAHQARNTARVRGHPFKQDLTKVRREWISEAHAAMREWPQQGASQEPVYCYANINCQVVMRRGRSVERIHCHDDLQSALRHFRPQ